MVKGKGRTEVRKIKIFLLNVLSLVLSMLAAVFIADVLLCVPVAVVYFFAVLLAEVFDFALVVQYWQVILFLSGVFLLLVVWSYKKSSTKV
jgi:hypothetical protein